MSTVYDSNILIDALNGMAGALNLLQNSTNLKISVITEIEVLAGAKDESLEDIKKFLSQFEILPIDKIVVEIAAELRRKGKKLRLPDAIIYATAKANNCKLVTRNTKDFDVLAADIILPY